MRRSERQYVEEGYSRHEGSSSLAIHTIGEANNKPYELGQSAALAYLAYINRLSGNITLNKIYISFDTDSSVNSEVVSNLHGIILVDLSKSSLCGTEITNWRNEQLSSVFGFSYSLMKSTVLHDYFKGSDFLAADLSNSTFNNVFSPYSRFAAATLRGTTFHGGIFQNTDFQGTDLRDVKTERGYVGAGYIYYGGTWIQTFTPDNPEWPVIFGKDMSTLDSLKIVGRATDESADTRVVDFTNARFLYADLRGANLLNSNISQKQVNEACADDTTLLPNGVRPLSPENCSFPQWLLDTQKSLRSPTYESAFKEAGCKSALGGQ